MPQEKDRIELNSSPQEQQQPVLRTIPPQQQKTDAELIAYIDKTVGKEFAFELAKTFEYAGGLNLEDTCNIISEWKQAGCLPAISVLMEQGKTVQQVYDCITDYIKSREYAGKVYEFFIDVDRKGNIIKEELTLERFQEFLQSIGVSVKLDQITKRMSFDGFNPCYSVENLNMNLPTIICSELKRVGCFKDVTSKVVADYLSVIATQNSINPVKELIDNGNGYDGKDYLSELYEIMGIDENDSLSRLLIRKWLHQSLSLALYNNYNKPFGADGCLTLYSKSQGIGKTRLISMLAMENNDLFKEGQSITADKDTKRRCITTWLCELGEIDKTFSKTSASELKQFITQSFDEYRLPYGKNDVRTPRRSSLYGTCNEEEFLVDSTGSRRYWVIPVSRSAMQTEKINEWAKNKTALQLWKQIYLQYVKDDVEHTGFRLTQSEQKELEDRNASFCKKVNAQTELEDYLVRAEINANDYKYVWATASDLKLSVASLKRYDSKVIGKALKILGIEDKRIKGATVYNIPLSINYINSAYKK